VLPRYGVGQISNVILNSALESEKV
jgi:hypothetical protein